MPGLWRSKVRLLHAPGFIGKQAAVLEATMPSWDHMPTTPLQPLTRRLEEHRIAHAPRESACRPQHNSACHQLTSSGRSRRTPSCSSHWCAPQQLVC